LRLRSALAFSLCLVTPALAEDAFRWVAQPGFQDAGSAHHGIVPLQQGKLWGLMNSKGEWLVEPIFEAVGQPGKGWFPVQMNGKWGIVSETGETIAGFDYDQIGTPSDYTPMKFQGAWYALGPSMEFDADPLPFDTLVGNDSTCMVGTANGVPVSSNRGDTPLDQPLPDFDTIMAPSEGHVGFTTGGRAGHFDCAYGSINGGEAGFDEVRPFSDGLAAVRLGQGWGFAGQYDNAFEIGGDWQSAREFSEGLAPVKQGGLWGYVDLQGKFVIPPQFDQAYSFSDGLAGVEVGGKRGFILADGSFAAEPQFDDFWRHDGGVVPVRQGELWGVIAPEATDPATRLNLPLEALATAQASRQAEYTLQPSNPHYYVFQDVASVHSVFVSPDEKVMLTTVALHDAAEIGLWDFTTHRLIRKFKVPEVTQAVLLPGHEIIAAGLSTGHVVLLDAVTGAELARVHPHQSAVIDMVLSPDGKRLATTDGTGIQIWDTASGTAAPPIMMKAHKLRYSHDNSVLYAGTVRGGLVKMTPEGEVLAAEPEGPELEFGEGPFDGAVSAMALTPGGTLVNLRTVSEQKADGYYYPRSWLEIVEESGARKVDLPEGMRDILTLDVSADGKYVTYAGQTEEDYVAKVEIRELATGKLIFSQTLNKSDAAAKAGLSQFVYSIDRLAFAPKGALVMVGMEGQDIVLLDPSAGKVLASFAEPLVTSQSSAALLDGSRYFSSDGNGSVWIWDLAQGRLENSVKIGENSAGTEEMIETDGDRFYLYSGLDDGIVNAFDMTTLAPAPLSAEEAAKIYAGLDYDPSVPLPPEVQAGVDALPADGMTVALAAGRIGVVSEPVGLHRAYDLKTGALLAEFLATPDGEWLVVTPEGFFAASPNGANLVSVSNGLRAFAVDQAYQALYRPDLVQAKLAGDPDGTVAKAAAELDLARILGSGPAPYTQFSFPREGAKAQSADIDVEIELQDEGGGIGRVEWRLNGMTVEVQPTREAIALEEETPKAKARMALDPGQNVIEVVAYNAAGLLASAPRQLTVTWDGVASSEPPALHVLAVGVNDYADGRLKLKYAAADAQAFAEAMKKAGAGLFSSVDVVTLLDHDVTEAKLDAAFSEMGKRAKSQDVFLFFLAGHGKTIEGKYYFIPQDFRFEGEDPIRVHGIDQERWQEWAARVKAKKSVMIYDTCESGSITETRSVDAAMAQSAAVERLTRAMGRTILSASTDDAPALEGYQGHGVMTWAMLDAFGQADTNGNATIEVTELASFLDVKVPEISSAAFGFRQVPQMSIKGSDFALGSKVSVLDAAEESFPSTLTHVVEGGTDVLDAPGGAAVLVIESGGFTGVYKIEEKDGFARIAKDGKALGWVAASALTPLQ
jgi:WD40 repeat protein